MAWRRCGFHRAFVYLVASSASTLVAASLANWAFYGFFAASPLRLGLHDTSLGCGDGTRVSRTMLDPGCFTFHIWI